MKNLKSILAICAIVTLAYSCKKSEPAHPVSKTPLLKGSWEVKSIGNQNLPADSIKYSFEETGGFGQSFFGITNPFKDLGSWNWDDDAQSVICISLNAPEVKYWNVGKLTESELWFTDGSNKEYHCNKN